MTTSGQRCGWKLCSASLSVIALVIATSRDCVKAQITPDDTLGTERSVVTTQPLAPGSTVVVDMIQGGATRGANLFHSFEQFSVLSGRAAYFNNAANIQNIISRVTGSSSSNIDGIIAAKPSANLFLLNPNGIVFGSNARLNIGGSFLASTASSLNFADGTQFSATAHSSTPLLTMSVPIGLQFGGTAGSILNQSRASNSRGLQVQQGKTLALVGGDVGLDGGILEAPGGLVELGGVAGAGIVGLNVDGNNLRLSFPDEITRTDISLSNGALVNASGLGGGNIQVVGRRVTLNGSSIASLTLGPQPGGTLTVDAKESIELTGTGSETFSQILLRFAFGTIDPFNLPNGIFTGSFVSATGAAGNIVINTPNFIARNGAIVSTSTSGQVQGGDITVNSEFVELNASALAATTGPSATGGAGNLTIHTRQLIARDNGFATTSSFGSGKGGVLTVSDSDSVELIGTNPLITNQQGYSLNTGLFTASFTVGDAGNLRVETGRLILRNGAIVSASTNGSGRGGNVTVIAPKSVELIGTAPNGDASLLAAATGTGSQGLGGSVTITTGNLIQDMGKVTVSSSGTGNAGNLEVMAGSIRLDNQAFLSSNTAAGQGNINLRSQDLVLRRGSSITTNAQGTAEGGNLTISTGVIAALENSDISATAEEATGGQIKIKAQGIFGTEFRETPTSESDITASSRLGPQFSGTVEFNTPDVDPVQGLATLPAELVEASGLIASGCAAVGENEFTVTGRGGLPENPSDTLSSDTVWSDSRYHTQLAENQTTSEQTTQPTNSTAEQLVEAQGWVFNNKGEVVLTATAVPVLTHSPWQTPAKCHAP